MENKTTFAILISIFYILGINAFVFGHLCLFSIILAFLLIISLLFKIISPKASAFLFLIFALGYFVMNNAVKEGGIFKNVYLNNVTLKGRITSTPQLSNNFERMKFYLDVDEYRHFSKTIKPESTRVLVVINNKDKDFKNIQIGDIIEVSGKLRAPKEATNPSQFDYAKYLKFKDTFCILYANIDEITVSSKADKFKNRSEFWWYLLQNMDSARDKIISKHAKYIKSPELEILGGIVFGNEAINPPDEIKQSFVNSGLLHLLAASGLNVALIFGIWWFLAQKLCLPYTISIGSGMFFVVLYTFMTGFPPSILRASIMILFVLFGKLIDRKTNTVALIFIVALLMLLFNPKMFLDVGFQLSFVVTIGLVSCMDILTSKFKPLNEKYIEKINDKPKAIKLLAACASPLAISGAVFIPLIAQIFVAPLQMYYFNTFTPLSFVANLAVVPFIGIISFLGFISSILSLIPVLGAKVIALFDFIVTPFLKILVEISKFFSSFDFSIITTPSPNCAQILIFWAFVIVFVQNIKENFKNKKLYLSAIFLLLLFSITFIHLPSKDFEILAFDVNNADSFLIKTPKNKYIMIDTAKAPYKGVSSAKMIMEEYLKDKNIKELELLIITHFDSDHSGGSVDILNDFKVKNTILQSEKQNTKTAVDIFKVIKKKNLPYKIATSGEVVYKESNFKIQTLKANIKGGSDNENSIVALVSNGKTNALFMGDVGSLGFKNLGKLPKIQILKLGHHGAKNSIDKYMIDTIKPDIAIVSTGYNTYGHPNRDILELLDDNNTEIYSTKECGAIKITAGQNGDFNVFAYKKGTKETFYKAKKDTIKNPRKIEKMIKHGAEARPKNTL